ncbi:ketopantoate reductase family protein [Mycolicibacterium canariasense]|uniref:ketopantoate reductase family protein n=1 Tax=Mycolicibacterium canariasense TaxID=228230 RepID=UPI0032D56B2B
MTTRIAVLGTGANGASVGADLIRAGLDVTFIEQWPDHVDAMRRNGVRVTVAGSDEVTAVRVHHLCEVAEMRRPFDVVLLMVKAYDTRWACELIKPALAADGVVVGIQNGMTMNDISDVLGSHRTLGSVIEVASTMFEPGVVQRDTSREMSWFAVGGTDPKAHRRAPEIADILRHAGRVEVSEDIVSSKWMKLIANCTELVTSAVLDMTVMEAVRIPGMKDVMIEAGNEAVRTCLQLGHRLLPIIGMTAEDVTGPEHFAEALLAVVHDDFSIEGQLTTVLQDWRKGRRSEVHELNGHIVAEQRRLGGLAPVNAAVVALAEQVENGTLPAGSENMTTLLATLR